MSNAAAHNLHSVAEAESLSNYLQSFVTEKASRAEKHEPAEYISRSKSFKASQNFYSPVSSIIFARNAAIKRSLKRQELSSKYLNSDLGR